MSSGLTTDALKGGLARMARKMEECFDELNALDSQVGDGDIGVTMATGFNAMLSAAAGLPTDVGLALAKCAQAFTGTRGSSFGTLLATGILAAAKETTGQQEVPWSKVPDLLAHGIEKMAQRGRSRLGEKTVLDALAAIRRAVLGLEDARQMAEAARQAATKALDDFRQRPCRQGRARIFADKTIGLDDPGMVVIHRLVQVLEQSARENDV